MSALQTEFSFTLPKGFIDKDGGLHRAGTMRLATARDEIEPLRDPRVADGNDPFLTVIVLSRVITELGSLSQVTPNDVQNLFAADLAFLQDFYGIINFGDPADLEVLQGSVAPRAAQPTTVEAIDDDAVASPAEELKDEAPSRAVWTQRHRGGPAGRSLMIRYPEEALWDEITYLAYHLHWDMDTLLDLDHNDRTRLVKSVASLNERAWEGLRSRS